jgi:hypothetical protein
MFPVKLVTMKSKFSDVEGIPIELPKDQTDIEGESSLKPLILSRFRDMGEPGSLMVYKGNEPPVLVPLSIKLLCNHLQDDDKIVIVPLFYSPKPPYAPQGQSLNAQVGDIYPPQQMISNEVCYKEGELEYDPREDLVTPSTPFDWTKVVLNTKVLDYPLPAGITMDEVQQAMNTAARSEQNTVQQQNTVVQQ